MFFFFCSQFVFCLLLYKICKLVAFWSRFLLLHINIHLTFDYWNDLRFFENEWENGCFQIYPWASGFESFSFIRQWSNGSLKLIPMAGLSHSVRWMLQEMWLWPLHRCCSSCAAWGSASIWWRWSWDTLAAFGCWTLWKSCWSPAVAVAAGCKWTEFISVLLLALRTHTPSARHPSCCWTWPTRSPCAGCSCGAPTPPAYQRICTWERELVYILLL